MYLFTISYGSNATDQRSGDGWISGWSKIIAFYQRNSWAKLWGTRRKYCFSTEHNYPEYPLQEQGQSGGNESSERRPLPPKRQIAYLIYEYFRVTGANDSVENYADLFTIALRNDDVQEFDLKWDENLRSMTQIPSDEISESLYKLRIRESEKLKTVLWNCTIWRFIGRKLDLMARGMVSPRQVRNRRRRTREGPEPVCVQTPIQQGGTKGWKDELTSCRGTVKSSWQKPPVRRKGGRAGLHQKGKWPPHGTETTVLTYPGSAPR